MGWEDVLKTSDFHNVISTVYPAMLGVEKDISEDCSDRFYQKYRRELLLEESYKNAEEAIRWQLGRHKIHALLLAGTKVYNHYPKQDMGYIGRLEILVDKKDLPYVHRFMRDMDYEEKEKRIGSGFIYRRTPGIEIVFYDEIPLGNRVLKKYFSDSIKKYICLDGNRYIHVFMEEEEYLYTAGQLVEKYIMGELKVREIMDFWQLLKSIGVQFQWKIVADLLEKAKLGEFVCQIGILAQIWFGDVGNIDCGTALELEEYILSGGKENRRLNAAILPHERFRLDFYRRDREEEWSEKRKEWWFPPKDYMAQLFPVLKKHPFLLGPCWMIRNFRFFRNSCRDKYKTIVLRVKTKWLDFKEAWKARFGRKQEGTEDVLKEESQEDAQTKDADTEVEAEVEEIHPESAEKEQEENDVKENED